MSRVAGVEKFVGSRFTPTCNTSCVCPVRRTRTPFGLFNPSYGRELGPYLASRQTRSSDGRIGMQGFREPRAPDSTGESKTLRTPRAFYRTRSAFRGAR